MFRLASFIVTTVSLLVLQHAGAGWYSLIIVPFGLFAYYEGLVTGAKLREGE
jgi:hypothetical protein